MTVIETIAHWSHSQAGFSPAVRARAADAVLDTVGCIIAATGNPVTAMARRGLTVVGQGAGASAVIGDGTAAPGWAALINGTAAHALDFDDTFGPLMGHASAVLVPALLALGQAAGTNGTRLLDAYVVGLEAQALIGAGVNPGHYAVGWHATSTVGLIGAAAGAAWLLGLDEAGIAGAMSLAVSMAAGTKGQFGTPAKPLHAGLAARNGIEAAMLAAAGMTGRTDIIEHRLGFTALYAGDGKPWAEVLAAIGAPLAIEGIGLTSKRHPCCAATHSTLDTLFTLKALHQFRVEDVVEVDTLVGPIQKSNLSYADPVNEMQARFSMNYCVAVALAQDRLRIADFTQAAVDDPARRRLLPLVNMHTDPAETPGGGEVEHRVTVRLRDGRDLSAPSGVGKGTAADPFDESDRRAKYDDCCAGHLDPRTADALYARLAGIAGEASLDFISTAFAAAQ